MKSTLRELQRDNERIRELGSLEEILAHREEFSEDTQELLEKIDRATQGDAIAFSYLAELLGELEPGYTENFKRKYR